MNGPSIYVFCPDLPHPMGGVRMLYRHVDILNANGFDAAIVHMAAGFRVEWFDHSTRVLHMPVKLNEQDIAVFAEVGGLKIGEWAQGNRKVIFNQNAYYTFLRYPLEGGVETPYLHPEMVATIVVSEDSRNYLQHVFPALPIHRIRYSIDPKLYFPQEKKRQICFMPRKNVEDAKQVLYILRYRKKLTGWTIRPIDGVSEGRAAEILRESAIFMSFGHPEGFGLPPAEAMAAEAIVIGYDGRGGAEFWPGHAIRIEMGDTPGYAEVLERLLEEYDRDPARLKQMAGDAGRFVRDTYSPEAESQSIVECWEKILGKAT
jgi:glycosyltransferase involved in cell wall biosynthesis